MVELKETDASAPYAQPPAEPATEPRYRRPQVPTGNVARFVVDMMPQRTLGTARWL